MPPALSCDCREDEWHLGNSAALTGALLALITSGSVVFSALFPRRFWCRFLCPIGGMNGLFAKLSATELRSQKAVCSSEHGGPSRCGAASRSSTPAAKLSRWLRLSSRAKGLTSPLCAARGCPHPIPACPQPSASHTTASRATRWSSRRDAPCTCTPMPSLTTRPAPCAAPGERTCRRKQWLHGAAPAGRAAPPPPLAADGALPS